MAAESTRARRWLVARQGRGATLVETALLCALMLVGLALAGGGISAIMLQRGLLNAAVIAALWGALRLVPARGSLRRRVVVEALMAIAVTAVAWGLTMIVAVLEVTYGDLGSLTRADVYLSSLFVSGFLYVCGRVAVAAWLIWGRLRRRHMIWALTHTQLIVALLAASPLVVLVMAYARYQLMPVIEPGATGLFPTAISTLVLSAPMLGLVAMLAAAAIAALVPILAIPSYIAARHTTRHLDALARTARALRRGDLTARVEVHGEDEVAQLQRDVNAMAADLERAMGDLAAERDRVAGLLEARRELVAGVSHELRAPVAVLRAHLEAALEGDAASDGVRRHDLELMSGEVVRLQRLIEDLFALSRAEVGRLTMRREPVALRAVAERIVGAMEPMAWDRHRVRLMVEASGDVQAAADPQRVEQILVNLVHNAWRHTGPGGMVMVSLRRVPPCALLEVRDTGDGIAPEDLPHVWERYYRGPGAHDDEGTGLGLALVRQLTEAMGGRVEAVSVPGEGSCFSVYLPLA